MESMGQKVSLAFFAAVLIWSSELWQRSGAVEPPTYKPNGMRSFYDSAKYYRYLTLDKKSNSLYVGAMDYVYRLNLNDITNREGAYLKSSMLNAHPDAIATCKVYGKSGNFDCKNHIRIIHPEGDQVYICGTGAYKPTEYILNANLQLNKTRPKGSGEPKCPFDPNENATSIFVEKGNPNDLPAMYSATNTDGDKNDPLIYRPRLKDPRTNFNANNLRTANMPNWLLKANFVGSFEHGDYVYFFFREEAVEHCGNAIYSRVARVCKRDLGGRDTSRSTWTSFLKVRLLCSIPGKFPFDFNQIHDVFRSGANTFFGVFTTNTNGLVSSAVCSFTMTAIDAAFRGPFIHQRDTESQWKALPDYLVPRPRPGQCQEDSRQLQSNVIDFIEAHPMMYNSVQSEPLFYKRDVVFQRLVVDPSPQYPVLFLGTNQGEVYKVVVYTDSSGTRQSNILAVWKPFNRILPIWNIKINRQYLYLGTDTEVTQIDIRQCSRYVTCDTCIRDPYCGWDKTAHNCQNHKTGLIQSVPGSENLVCRGTQIDKTITIHTQGDVVHLQVLTHRPTKWFQLSKDGRTEREIKPDNVKHIFTQQNGLIIMNATNADDGSYSARDYHTESDIARFAVRISECDPFNVECQWKQKFKEWCSQFDDYRSEFTKWRTCVKGQCSNDELSNTISNCYSQP